MASSPLQDSRLALPTSPGYGEDELAVPRGHDGYGVGAARGEGEGRPRESAARTTSADADHGSGHVVDGYRGTSPGCPGICIGRSILDVVRGEVY